MPRRRSTRADRLGGSSDHRPAAVGNERSACPGRSRSRVRAGGSRLAICEPGGGGGRRRSKWLLTSPRLRSTSTRRLAKPSAVASPGATSSHNASSTSSGGRSISRRDPRETTHLRSRGDREHGGGLCAERAGSIGRPRRRARSQLASRRSISESGAERDGASGSCGRAADGSAAIAVMPGRLGQRVEVRRGYRLRRGQHAAVRCLAHAPPGRRHPRGSARGLRAALALVERVGRAIADAGVTAAPPAAARTPGAARARSSAAASLLLLLALGPAAGALVVAPRRSIALAVTSEHDHARRRAPSTCRRSPRRPRRRSGRESRRRAGPLRRRPRRGCTARRAVGAPVRGSLRVGGSRSALRCRRGRLALGSSTRRRPARRGAARAEPAPHDLAGETQLIEPASGS